MSTIKPGERGWADGERRTCGDGPRATPSIANAAAAGRGAQGATRSLSSIVALALAPMAAISLLVVPLPAAAQVEAPAPLLSVGHPVEWFFAFKTNTATDPGAFDATRKCLFGGSPIDYPRGFSLGYGVASSEAPTFAPAFGLIGSGDQDPLGATFAEAYNGHLNYVVWNDQFYSDPDVNGCGDACSKPWAHSKGFAAWDDHGDGFVVQVSTPSWPAAGSRDHARKDGNTLGCVTDNDVLVSQHFFALKLNKDNLVKVLTALQNASVVTDPNNPQIVHNGGPPEVQALVNGLGHISNSTSVEVFDLAPHVRLISKPAKVTAPPWQLVSAKLGGVSLRVANWWEPAASKNPIPDTRRGTKVGCLDKAKFGAPGAVTIAKTGAWKSRAIGLTGGSSADKNHAKVAVSTDGDRPLTIFGDMNQEGALSAPCAVSQNPRGGLFYVVEDASLNASVTKLISPPAR